jgi:glutamate N-acetyltransferase/amino-acid N-acetyltransferase
VDAVSVTSAGGFEAAGVSAGIKGNGRPDVALVAAARPVPAAAVFTTNRAAAPPIRLSRKHLAAGTGIRGVVVNSGCANAATGERGVASARLMAAVTAGELGAENEQILVCSTGPIGTYLDDDAVTKGISAAAGALAADPASATAAANAIMTTDSVPKETTRREDGWALGGMAKGAGMVRPDMATMLAVLTTDAVVDDQQMTESLGVAVDASFHALNIDGCASTNDAVIVLASGASGVTPDPTAFTEALSAVCRDLARQLAADAEGATRVVTLRVSGAPDDATGRRVGRAIADSALVRSAFYGGDPNWGRIVGQLGAAWPEFQQDTVRIGFEGTTVADRGEPVAVDEESLAARLGGDFEVEIDLGIGQGQAVVVTTDLTPDYVVFNGERS